MKNLGLKSAGVMFSILWASACFAGQPLENATLPSKDSVLMPGAKIVGGLPGKNDLYILGKNEKIPTELIEKVNEKPRANVTIQKAHIVQENAPAINADNNALTTTPPIAVKQDMHSNPITEKVNQLQAHPVANEKAVTSMKKFHHKVTASNHRMKGFHIRHVASAKMRSANVKKVASRISHHAMKRIFAVKSSHIVRLLLQHIIENQYKRKWL